MTITRLAINLEIEGNPQDAHYVVDTLLDNGVPQDSINEHEMGVGELHVKSAVVRGDDAPQSCYPDEIETLREMLADQRTMMAAIEEGVAAYRKRWGSTPLNVSTIQRRELVQKRIEALTTAVEVMGGAL